MKYAKDIEHKIMNVFVIFSVSIFLYFRFHIFDQGACSNTVAPSINRDPRKPPRLYTSKIISFTRFLFHMSHKSQCKLANTDYFNAQRTMAVFSLMLTRIHDLMEISSVRFSIPTSTVYLRSFTQTRLTASW